jgi:MFS family permease
MADAQSLHEKTYAYITGDDEADRLCDDIPESACKHQPRNFLLNVGNGMCTKLAEQLASPGLVLPWLLATIGAPSFLAGWLVPIRKVGSLAPQMMIAGALRRAAVRKWFWVLAGAVQAVALVLMALAVAFLPATAAGLSVVALLAVFSVASGVGSVSFSDVVGKTIDAGKRGRILALRASLGGVLALIAGGMLRSYGGENDSIGIYITLLIIAACLWVAGSVLFALKHEHAGATDGSRTMFTELTGGWSLLKSQSPMRRFIAARSFLVAVELSIPFYALHARSLDEIGSSALGIFIIAVSLSEILSSPVWGKLADSSSRWVMVVAGGIAAAAGVLALSFTLLPDVLRNAYVYGVVFLLVGLAHGGIRLGRKTWIIDAAPRDERPTWVALSNTIVGLVTIIAAGLGVIADLWSVQVLLIMLIVVAVLGSISAWWMPEASDVRASHK